MQIIPAGNDQIIHGDCIEALEALPKESVDMGFADPPYNLQLQQKLQRPDGSEYLGVQEQAWDKFASLTEYDEFTRAWLKGMWHVLKPNGTLWVSGTYHNIHRIGALMQDAGWWIINEVIWIKANPTPNFRGVRLTNAQETLLWAKKGEKSTYTFNYQLLKALNGGKQMRSDWYLPICASRERLKDAAGDSVHRTQKPLALLFRTLLAATRPGDLVIDPFFGTGTTGAAARLLNRRFIGIERAPEYLPYIQSRLDGLAPIIQDDGELLDALAAGCSPRREPGVYASPCDILRTFQKSEG